MRPALTRHDLAVAAERAVSEYLVARGYEIVASNLRMGYLELDLVARKGQVVAVVEVRTRGPRAWTTGLGSMGPLKRQRIRRAGERLWQRRYRNDDSVERMRFDAASVRFDARGVASVEYVIAAF
ncbi:MAG: YraN family protein [Polyangiaceae bacterium]|nr:YraN family protein [Polyangiaceae bacterium]